MINFKNKTIYGWSKSDFSKCEYLETSNIEIINEIFDFAKKNNKKISFRSGGRSYGDNTLNKNNIVLKYVSKENILSFDKENGEIVVSGSCSLLNLFKYIISKGWSLNVTPASQFITIAGAISNNVHGKNCPSKGYFGDYVEEIELLTPDKGLLKCSRFKNDELPITFIIDSKNKMIVDAPIPKNLRLYIKGSNEPSVDKNMETMYESDVIDILDQSEYNIN